MKFPVISGNIERRILVNYSADPEVVKPLLPEHFTPQLVNGKAIVGICLIRLSQVRPKGLPGFLGFRSENGAHRIAVEWQEQGQTKTGVYIPRRDSNSIFNTLVGGRIFPGRHYHAVFKVQEDAGNYQVAFTSSDGTLISVDASIADHLPVGSIFGDMDTASNFLKAGATGFSPNGRHYDGLRLKALRWEIKPLKTNSVYSSFFADERIFPKGSVKFDNALLMTNIAHEWESVDSPFCK